MSDFKANTHQIRFPLGLHPRPRYSVPLPRHPAVFQGPTSEGGNGRERKRRGKEEKIKGREEEVEGGIWPAQKFWRGAPMILA